MHPGKKLRKALAGKGLITAPGVYDMISAKIADAMGFTTLYMTGFGVSATLGMPDAGLASYTEMVERVSQICRGTSTIWLASSTESLWTNRSLSLARWRSWCSITWVRG